MTEQAQPGAGAIGAEIDAALLAKNKAIDEAANENVDSPPAKEPPKDEVKEDPVQKRIDKLTREKYDARRKADLAEYRSKELEARLAALEAKPAAVAQREPTLESVGYDETKYREAMRDWLKAEVLPVAREEAKKVLSVSKAETVHSQFDQRQAEFAKSNPDYIELVMERETLPISEEMQEVLKQVEIGPAVVLHLVKNEEKAREIMALPLPLQAIEIGRIQASLEIKKATPPPVSKAPPPPAKLEATESPKELDINDSSGWTDKQFLKWRKQHMK